MIKQIHKIINKQVKKTVLVECETSCKCSYAIFLSFDALLGTLLKTFSWSPSHCFFSSASAFSRIASAFSLCRSYRYGTVCRRTKPVENYKNHIISIHLTNEFDIIVF